MEIDAVYSWNVFKSNLCGGPERKARCLYFLAVLDWTKAGERPIRRFVLRERYPTEAKWIGMSKLSVPDNTFWYQFFILVYQHGVGPDFFN